jgi:hypothetical protein
MLEKVLKLTLPLALMIALWAVLTLPWAIA